MRSTKEEIAAGLVWHFVEEVREREASGEAVTFSRAELNDLVDLLAVAAHVPGALDEESSPALQAAVRARLEQQLARCPAQQRTVEPSRRSVNTPNPARGNWGFRAVSLVAAGLTLALATVSVWHRPRAVVKRVYLPQPVAEIQPVEESQAHDWIPRMVRNELEPQQERDLMWHMLLCRGCFNRFVHAQRDLHAAPTAENPLLRLVSR